MAVIDELFRFEINDSETVAVMTDIKTFSIGRLHRTPARTREIGGSVGEKGGSLSRGGIVQVRGEMIVCNPYLSAVGAQTEVGDVGRTADTVDFRYFSGGIVIASQTVVAGGYP